MMSHSELLQETEKAAGDVNLSSWHKMLIDEWKAQKEKQIVRFPLSLSLSFYLPISY